MLKGLALKRVPPIKFVVLISGAKFPPDGTIAGNAYAPPMTIPSLHFLGWCIYYFFFCYKKLLLLFYSYIILMVLVIVSTDYKLCLKR